MSEQAKLDKIRQRIDKLDTDIQKLISERAQCALDVAEVKRASGDVSTAEYYRPEREAQVLRAVLERNSGPLEGEAMARLFREIMSACLALEDPLSIAFLGPAGTFTQQAALKHFGQAINALPMPAIDEVFREVESGNAHYGVVPVENSTEGVINHTLDIFVHSPLKISGEVELRIHHHLVGAVEREGLGTVTRVYSHQQSFAQCRNWLDAYMPRAERISVSSNAEAARRTSEDAESLAICGEMAADLYGQKIVVRSIEDEPDNTTRFLIIGRQDVPPSGNDKTTLLIATDNRSGSLYRLLEPFSRNAISMTRIESRPSRRGMWDYVFFVDIEGHVDDQKITAALAELEEQSSMLKVLGSYPSAVL